MHIFQAVSEHGKINLNILFVKEFFLKAMEFKLSSYYKGIKRNKNHTNEKNEALPEQNSSIIYKFVVSCVAAYALQTYGQPLRWEKIFRSAEVAAMVDFPYE